MYLVGSYLSYLVISIAVTIWVAQTLHRHGRIFLVDTFLGNEPLADSVNQLLVVGFYLINVGFLSLALRSGIKPDNAAQVIEYLSTKIGLVLLILGLMHFINIRIFSTMRRRATERAHPPVAPSQRVAPPEAV
jgi:hypothetical protein